MKPLLFALPGNERFCAALAQALEVQTGALEHRRFPDGESYVRFQQPVEGRDLALVCTLNDPDAKTLAVAFAAHTARELGARSVGLVAPYLAYMRQDKRFLDGEAVSSVHYAKLLSQACDWLVTVDPHLHRYASLGEIYSIPAQAVRAAPTLATWVGEHVREPLIVGPDEESGQWVAEVARACAAPHAVMTKTRLGDRHVEIGAPSLAAWKGRTPVLVDDIISSAHTMALAAVRIRDAGLAAPLCVGVHGLFAPGALDALAAAGVETVVTTNTVAHQTNALDVVPLVAQALADGMMRV
ncbi:MAG TPA: ribose-phosphate diphosphokinase [Ramlibacter sp.]|nr:ribose-phosphate diphosphokinase [Ramlibacter sp.]